MDILKDIIQRCHKKHAEENILRQRKTVITPALYKGVPYHIKVHCVRANPLTLDALEHANISFMPIGHAPENDEGPQDLGGHRFKKRQTTEDWRLRQWEISWGLQIYTGIPSERDGARWHDLEFSYAAICHAPEAVSDCVEALLNTLANPLLTLTKSGGLRFTCRIWDYLHPDNDAAKYYIYKHTSTQDNSDHRDIYLEIRGDKGYSRWDMRYEVLVGDLLEPPYITKEMVFAPINTLRAALHEPESSPKKFTQAVVPASLNSVNLDLAKEAFLKRGFSYERGINDFHYWQRNDVFVALWEDQDTVWVRAGTPDTEIPIYAVPITDIWNDTGISKQTPFSEIVRTIREERFSPLGIKRMPPKLQKQQTSPKVYKTLKERSAQLQRIFARDTRILALTTSEADILTNTEAEKGFLNSRTTCLNISNRDIAETVEKRYQSMRLPSFACWKPIFFRWEQVKDIPVDIRMANPFQHGNVCEDPERYHALEVKGGNARASICPQCPAYTACQERGYLSQPTACQRAKTQITSTQQLFLDPRHTHLVQQTLTAKNDTARMCIIHERETSIDNLFLECELLKKVVETWIVNWQGQALGKFAVALMNVIEIQTDPYSNPIGQVRAAVRAFHQYEDEIIQQMCHLNVQGRVVPRRAVESETKTELARYAIDFHCGATAYIPLDANAETILSGNSLPFLPLSMVVDTFQLSSNKDNETEITPIADIRIPMTMTDAIALGILDVQTVEKIDLFPTVCQNPAWTYWHQLRCFFAHYPRNADAPMQWCEEYLKFWIPSKLPSDVNKHLLLILPSLSDQQLRKVFPDEEMDVVRVEPTAWMPGNKVFQIRSSGESLHEILNYDGNTSVMELSKLGERYFSGIRAEIDKDPNIKHAIVTNGSITGKLTDLAARQNVCFVAPFKTLHEVETNFEAAQVLWIVGTPYLEQHTIWREAQMLFGNDEKPLNYEGDMWTGNYKDKRIQEIFNQNISGLLTQIVGRAGLNRNSGKTLMLLTDFELPDITDRQETLLFDWEDFEIAGGLDKLEETIRTRERFEAEQAKLTAETSREEVERILGCSSRQANRILNKLRGGNIPRITLQEQILFLLASGREKTTSALVAAIDSSPQAIGNKLKQLLNAGEIVRVRRGVYTLPETKASEYVGWIREKQNQ